MTATNSFIGRISPVIRSTTTVVAGKIDEKFFARGMALPHRRAKSALEDGAAIAEPAVAEPVWIRPRYSSQR
jgi:hypothetical protein